MASRADFPDIPGMTRELRNGAISALDALSAWRDELDNVNKRYLGKVLDQTSAAARSMGWPDEAIRATGEYLEKVSTVQTSMIDQITDGWEHQLSSTSAPTAMPRSLLGPVPGIGAMPQFNPLEPWKFWLQAAEMWQRTWLPEEPSARGRKH
jgi:hypothetical protein